MPPSYTSAAPDFRPTTLLARLDHVRAFLLDHPELLPHVSSVEASVFGRNNASIYLRSDSGHAPLLQIGPPTRMIRSATAMGGLQRTAYLDLDGLTLVAFETLSAEQLDAALMAGGVR